MQPIRRLVVLRGLPGSGKSYLAKQLLAEAKARAEDQQGAVLATDDFFLNPATGNYDWNLPKAHLWNQLRARRFMEKGATPLLIDNTNLQAWEASPYVCAAHEFDYQVEIVEPNTAWANDTAECSKRGTHGLRDDALSRLAGKREDYSVKDAVRAAAVSSPIDDKDRKKVELMIENLFAKPAAATALLHTSASNEPSGGKRTGVIRVEISKNDGRKAQPKPLLIKPSATMDEVARLACNVLKLRVGNKGHRLFTIRGDEITSVDELSTGMQVVFSDNGQNYVPIALRKTAAERRVERAERALAMAEEEDNNGEDEDEDEGDEGDDKGKNAKKESNRKKREKEEEERRKEKGMAGVLRGISKFTLGANEVSPRIYVGSARDAHTPAELQRLGLTHILNCAGDFPSSRATSIVASHHLQLMDVESASLAPHLAAAFDFIDGALQHSPESRVLVHCVVGKSRSVSIALAYLIARQRVPLRIALQQVRLARPIASPNAGFMQQLLALERRELTSTSIGWDELPHTHTSILAWLTDRNEGGAIQRATHIWCEANGKPYFRILPHRNDELLGLVAQLLTSPPPDPHPLVLIELPDAKRACLHVDVDMFLESAVETTVSVFASLFVSILSAMVAAQFPGLPPSAYDVTVTGCVGAHVTPSRPKATWKVGLHLIWRKIHVNNLQLLATLRAFIGHLTSLEEEKSFPLKFPLASVRACNEWSDVIDLSQPETGLRMLYSSKRESCRVCAHKTEGKRAREKKPQPDCLYCKGTGYLPERKHSWVGVFASDGSRVALDLADESTARGLLQRMQLSSIVPPLEICDAVESGDTAAEAEPVLYTGAVLDLADQARLLEALPPPQGWQVHASHVTLCIGPHQSALGCALGDRLSLTVTGVGRTEGKVIAVRVAAPSLRCLNSTVPHVTVATAPGVPPVTANQIAEWSDNLPGSLGVAALLSTVQHVTHSSRRAPHASSAALPSSALPPAVAPLHAPALTLLKFTPPPNLTAASFTRLLPKGLPKDCVLPVINHLRAHGDGALSGGGQVKVVRHALHRQLVQLSYGQASADFSDPVIRDCRGIIVDAKDDYRIIALPYSKFFNAGEARADELEWSSTRVYEKADGSLALLYHYKDEWHVASSSSPDGSGMVTRSLSFAELFWDIWRSSAYTLPINTRLTYMFELLSPRFYPNIAPKRDALLLHGVRDRDTLEEMVAEEVAHVNGWECVPTYSFGSLAAVLAAARRLDVTQQEGFVAVDSSCRRVKIKSPAYVALTLLRGMSGGAVGTTHMLEIVRTNEGGEFLAAFPEYKILYGSVATKYEALVASLARRISANATKDSDGEEGAEDEHEDENEETDEAELAAEIKASGSTNVRAILASLPLDRVHRLLGLGAASATAVDNKIAKSSASSPVAAGGTPKVQGHKKKDQKRYKERRGKRNSED